MDYLINMMVSDESPADISDKIKEILMQKSAQNIETIRPTIAASIVSPQTEVEPDSEEVGEVENSETPEASAEEEPETSEEDEE